MFANDQTAFGLNIRAIHLSQSPSGTVRFGASQGGVKPEDNWWTLIFNY